jgi:hypothetical protein
MKKDISKTYLYLIMVLLLGLLLASFIKPLMEGLATSTSQKLKNGDRCNSGPQCESNNCVLSNPITREREDVNNLLPHRRIAIDSPRFVFRYNVSTHETGFHSIAIANFKQNHIGG